MLSIVVPVDLSRRPIQLLERVFRLVQALRNTPFQIVIGHNDRGSIFDEKIKSALNSEHSVTLVSAPLTYCETSQSALRNMAVKAAKYEILLLLDADIYPDVSLFNYLHDRVVGGEPYAMAPCLYLTECGTKRILKNKNGADITASYLKFNRKEVLHLAMPSSVIALKKDDYQSIGGFNEAYKGHGYEDFAFMIHLGIKNGLIKISRQLLIDKPYQAPLLAEGFRAVLGEICIRPILEKKMAFHLWHARNNKDIYYQKRSENAHIFKAEMMQIVGETDFGGFQQETPALVNPFFKECMKKGLTPNDFYVLFHAAPSHIGRSNFMIRATKKISEYIYK